MPESFLTKEQYEAACARYTALRQRYVGVSVPWAEWSALQALRSLIDAYEAAFRPPAREETPCA